MTLIDSAGPSPNGHPTAALPATRDLRPADEPTSRSRSHPRSALTTTPRVTHFTPTQLLRIARLFADRGDLLHRFDEVPPPPPGQRPWARLAATADLEVWLLGWAAGSATGWHDHGPSRGAFVGVAGELLEQGWSAAGAVEHRIAAGDGRAFGAEYVHNVLNPGSRFAASVHAYSSALTRMRRYDVVGGRLLEVGAHEEGRDW